MIAVFRANPQAFSGATSIACALAACCAFLSCPRSKRSPTTRPAAEVSRQTAEWSGGVVADTTPESDRLRLVTPAGNARTADAGAGSCNSRLTAVAAVRALARRARRIVDSKSTDPGLAQAQQNVEPTPAQPPVEEKRRRPKLRLRREEPTPAAEEPVAPAAEAPPRRRRLLPLRQRPSRRWLNASVEYWWLVIALGSRGRGRCDGGVHSPPPRERRRRFVRFAVADRSISNRRRNVRRARWRRPSKGGRADAFLVEGEDDAGLVKTNLDDDLTSIRRRRPRVANLLRLAASISGAAAPAASRVDDTMSSESAVRFDQQDALAEADFHMAYGLYDQAADLVKIAIDREPASPRPEAQAARDLLRVGQQGSVPRHRARSVRHA